MKKKIIFKLFWVVLVACLSFYSQKTKAQKTVTVTNGDGSQEVVFSNPSISFSTKAYMTVDVTNNTSNELAVKLLYNGNQATQTNKGIFYVPANQTKSGKVIWLRPSITASSPWYSAFPNVRGLPGNHAMDWSAFDASLLKQVVVTVYWENHTGGNQSVTISNPYASGDYTFPSISYSALSKPFFDDMGQYVHDNWDMKLSDKSELQALAAKDVADYSSASFSSKFSQYGGFLNGPKYNATGYFRTQKIDGKWWMIDPEGYLFWSHGVTGARSGSNTSTVGRETLFPTFTSESAAIQAQASGGTIDFYNINVIRKYGTDWVNKLEAVTYGRMKAWGLNTIGSWASAPIKVMHPYAEVIFHQKVDIPGITKKQGVDPFSSGFLTSLRGNLSTFANKWKNSPWIVGVYTSNELGWGEEIDIPKGIIGLVGSTMSARVAMENFYKTKYVTIQALNTAWGTNFADFASMTFIQTKYDASPAMKADFNAYLDYYADTYFRICKEEIIKYLPNHLYLGCRIHKAYFNNHIVKRAASRYCDVLSYNIYNLTVNDLELDLEVDKPVIVGEFHFGTGSHGVWGLGNGAHASDVHNQAEAYKYFVTSALKHPNFVGTHWFQWVDQMASGRGQDGENYRIGLVNITDQPYQPMVDVIKETSATLYETRMSKVISTNIDLLNKRKFQIYPNPSKGQFNINTNNQNITNLTVFSLTGQEVFETNFQGSKSITLPSNLNGVFLVKLENAGKVDTQRIVII